MVLLGALASVDPVRPAVFVLVLSTRRRNAVAFLVGWAAALSLLFVIAYVAFGGYGSGSPSSTQSTWASVLELLVGIGLFGVAVHAWSRRHGATTRPIAPQAVTRRLDQLDLSQAGLIGVLIQPRSLTIAAALVAARDHSGIVSLVIALFVFAAVSTASLLGILVYDVRHGEDARVRLSAIVEQLERHGPLLITIASAVGGAYLVWDALRNLIGG
jgi:Sap, sulfolipid-1-addressing protein